MPEQRNRPTFVWICLVIPGLIFLVLFVLFFTWLTAQKDVENRITYGEKSLLPPSENEGDKDAYKKERIKAIKEKNLQKAISAFEKLRNNQSNLNDPEALIFLNNVRIRSPKSYTIVVSVPINTNHDASLEILRGVAQAQNEIYELYQGKKVKFLIKVAIASDDDDQTVASKIANYLVNQQQQKKYVLGVVGHYASDTTIAAGKIYQLGKLVAISPVSSSVELTKGSSDEDNYIFRTVPSDKIAANSLAKYMRDSLKTKKVAVLYNYKNNYSNSLKNEFKNELKKGEISEDIDLSAPNFTVDSAVKKIKDKDIKVLMLAADSSTLDKAMKVVNISKQKKLDVHLLGGDAFSNPSILKDWGDAPSRMVVAVPWNIEKNAQSDFVSKSKELWGAQVNWRTALAYDATMALFTAIDKLDKPTREGVQRELSNPDFSVKGASGKIQFEKSGDRKNAQVQLVQIHCKNPNNNCQFVPLD